jgi:hypothetical protein
VLRVGKIAVTGEKVGHAADLAPAHGVGLAGERERPGAGAADLAGGKVQVDEGGILESAVDRLVEPLAVERQGSLRPREQARRLLDVRDRQIAFLRRALGCPLGDQFPQGVQSLGVRDDVGGVEQVLAHDDVQHGVEQCDVRAGP